MAVEELPPSDFCKIRVNLESLKFINYFDPVLSLFMTFERAKRLRFMFDPSRSLRPSA